MEADPLTVLFCVDGATLEVIDELRSERRLPTLERLIRDGAFGRMQSLATRRIMNEKTRRWYASPILWTTIATGKVPEKHGIRDFVLPIQGTSSVWMGSEDDPASAKLTIPEVVGKEPFTLRLRIHSHRANGEQAVQLLLNGKELETISVPVKWKELSVALPESSLRPVQNELALIFSRQTIPAERGGSTDRRRLACELRSLSIVDARGAVVFSLDPVEQRFSLGRGFYMPRGNLTEVQSVHWRAMPLWQLLGDLGHPVGVVGYWGTWPAYEVNGFLVSSRMGMREKRKASERLTWPGELAARLEKLAPGKQDLDELLARLHYSDCEPSLLEDKTGVKKILLQDEFYFRISRELLPSMDRGLFVVYFRSIDLASHVSLHWRQGAELREGCSETVREIVDQAYVQIDTWIGDLLEILPEHARVVVVSDHGEQPIEGGGHHAPYGIFLAAGEGIRAGEVFHGGSVLDVAPTVLHLFGAPIPLDMDGKVLAQIFEGSWLADHGPRYADVDTSFSSDEEALTEGREEILEQLRALGYIQ
jgi:predicted AlkP superfamily phosphohydrolase/phosphomutase